jgi:hypothetical protein
MGVNLSWPFSGQVLAYRVDRAAVGSPQWQTLACVWPGADASAPQGGTSFKGAFASTSLFDQSVELRGSNSYQYRVTSIGPVNPNGTRSTAEGIATVSLVAPAPLPVGVVTTPAGAVNKWLRLTWAATNPYAYQIVSSSYGYLAVVTKLDPPGVHLVNPAIAGTHVFTVTPVFANGVAGPATNVSVVVP